MEEQKPKIIDYFSSRTVRMVTLVAAVALAWQIIHWYGRENHAPLLVKSKTNRSTSYTAEPSLQEYIIPTESESAKTLESSLETSMPATLASVPKDQDGYTSPTSYESMFQLIPGPQPTPTIKVRIYDSYGEFSYKVERFFEEKRNQRPNHTPNN